MAELRRVQILQFFPEQRYGFSGIGADFAQRFRHNLTGLKRIIRPVPEGFNQHWDHLCFWQANFPRGLCRSQPDDLIIVIQ